MKLRRKKSVKGQKQGKYRQMKREWRHEPEIIGMEVGLKDEAPETAGESRTAPLSWAHLCHIPLVFPRQLTRLWSAPRAKQPGNVCYWAASSLQAPAIASLHRADRVSSGVANQRTACRSRVTHSHPPYQTIQVISVCSCVDMNIITLRHLINRRK
jgi:hypothetical protein